jgi:hypothetical protein
VPDVTRLMTKPVVLVHRTPGAEDAHGQPAYTVTTETTYGYVYQKRTGDRDSATGNISITWENLWVALAAGTPIDSVAAVQIDSVQYEVVGTPHKAWNPRRAAVEYVEIEVRRAAP